MSTILAREDLLEEQQKRVYVQDYSAKEMIDGVKYIEAPNHVSEDGVFTELLRITDGNVEKFPPLSLAQINRSQLLPGSVKAWHVHLKQNEIWHLLPGGHIILGLWDIRKNSATAGKSMRISLGGSKSQLVYIPQGVAHGAANMSTANAEILYFIDQKFSLEDPDELRLPWDSLGAEFWQALRD